MRILKCETCGSNLILSDDGMHAHCDVCGNAYEYKNPKEDYFIEQMNEANDLRQAMDFDDAIKKYRTVIKGNDEDAEAHFGLLLSKYGVAYEIDPFTEEYIPTFHRNMRGDISQDEDALAALKYASDKQKKTYSAQLAELRRIQEGIEKVASECKPYDVFVSFKATDADGNNTTDRDIAYNIYDELNTRGVRTFFSEVSLMDMASSDYEAVIFNALNTCKVFILVATSKENINATWVKNEWTRFREIVAEDMKSGVKAPQHFAVVGKDMKPNELPLIFAKTQNIMLAKYAGDSYKKDVALSVEKILGIEKAKPDVNVKIDDTKVAEMVAKIVEDKVVESKSKSKDLHFEYNKGDEDYPEGYYVSLANSRAMSVSIPATYNGKPVVGIADGAFEGSKLASVNIKEGIQYIGDNAFLNCKKLSNINIPNTVTYIGDSAFQNDNNLREISIPKSVDCIGGYAFDNCTKLSKVNTEPDWHLDDMDYMGSGIFKDTAIESFVVPEGLIGVGYSAFQGCWALTKVVLPSTITCIEEDCFNGSAIKEINLVEGIKTIESRAFNECTELTDIVFPSTLEKIEDSAFADTGLRNIILPEGLKEIKDYAFSGIKNIDKMVIPSTLTDRYLSSFVSAEHIGTLIINIKNNCRLINNCLSAVEGDYIDTIVVNDTNENTKIKFRYSQAGEKRVTNVFVKNPKATYPQLKKGKMKELFDLEGGVVETDRRILNFVFGATCLVKKDNILYSIEETASVIKCDSSYTGVYDIPPVIEYNGSEYAVTKIGVGAFNNAKCTGINIPDSVVNIRDNAMSGCNAITSIKAKNVNCLGREAFRCCAKVTAVSLPALNKLAVGAFAGCTSLESIELGKEVKEIPATCFNGCSALKTLDFIGNIINIDTLAFASCACLERVELPTKLISIGNNAFAKCTNLREINFNDALSTIGDQAFDSCTSLTNVRLSGGLYSVGNAIFGGCPNINIEAESKSSAKRWNKNWNGKDRVGGLFNKYKVKYLG